MEKSENRVNGRFGGELPPTVKEIVRAYIVDYGRRAKLIDGKQSLSREEIHLKQINVKVDVAIRQVLSMYGICGEAARCIENDVKSGAGSRSARSVSRVGSFLSRNTYIKIQEDIFWFAARELRLY